MSVQQIASPSNCCQFSWARYHVTHQDIKWAGGLVKCCRSSQCLLESPFGYCCCHAGFDWKGGGGRIGLKILWLRIWGLARVLRACRGWVEIIRNVIGFLISELSLEKNWAVFCCICLFVYWECFNLPFQTGTGVCLWLVWTRYRSWCHHALDKPQQT